MANLCVLYFQRATCSTFHTCMLNSHYGHIIRGSMVDIQSATTENRPGKKKEEEETRMWANAQREGHPGGTLCSTANAAKFG